MKCLFLHMCLHLQVEKQNEVTQADSDIAPGSDLLVEVLGPEYPGRLRAMGYNAGLKQSIIGIKEKNRKQEVLVLKEMKDKQEDHSTLIADMREEITMLRREMAGNRNIDVTSPVVNQTSIGPAPMADVLDNITVRILLGVTYRITCINALTTCFML